MLFRDIRHVAATCHRLYRAPIVLRRCGGAFLLAAYVVILVAWHVNVFLNGFGPVPARTFDTSFFLGLLTGVVVGLVLDRLVIRPAVGWHVAHMRSNGRK